MERVAHRAGAVVAACRCQRPWPPPYLYGFVAISLPASMIASTSGGADAGGNGQAVAADGRLLGRLSVGLARHLPASPAAARARTRRCSAREATPLTRPLLGLLEVHHALGASPGRTAPSAVVS